MPIDAHAQERVKLSDTVRLAEVEIKNREKIYQKGDTVIYNADSFNSFKNSVVEDILKKMPGITVSSSGRIQAQGKDVYRIFLNGTEFEIGDIRTLTQNFPAEIISSVQVMELYSKASQLSGVKDGNAEKVINLQLKEDIGGGVFGRASAGYGSNDRYAANNFSNYMSGALRLTSIGYITNTNSTDLNSEESNSSQRGNQANSSQKNFNVNYNYQVSPKLRLNGIYELQGRTNFLNEYRERTTYLPSGSEYIRSNSSNGTNDNTAHKLTSRLEWRLGNRTSVTAHLLLITNSTNAVKENSDTSYSSIADILTRSNASKSRNMNNNISAGVSFQKKWSDKRAALLRWDLRNGKVLSQGNDVMEYYHINTAVYNKVTNVLQHDRVDKHNTVYAQYSEKLSKRSTLQLDYDLSTQQGNDNKRVSLTDMFNVTSVDLLQSYRNEVYTLRQSGNLKYQYALENYSFSLGANFQSLNRNSKNQTEKAIEMSDSKAKLLPIAVFRYSTASAQTLEFTYNGTMNAPELSMLQPTSDVRDSLNIYTGNPMLKPEVFNKVQVSYTGMSRSKKNTLSVSLYYQWTKDRIVNVFSVVDNKTYSMPINMDGSYSTGISINEGINLSKKFRLIGSVSSGYNSLNLIINNGFQSTQNITLNPMVRAVAMYERFDLNASYNYYLGSLVSTSGAIQSYHTFELESKTMLPLKFLLQNSLNYTVNSTRSELPNQRFIFLSVGLSKEFTKVPGLFFRLSVNDVFNNYPNFKRTVGDNYIEESRYNVLGRYAMLSIIYRYNHFR